ncbi:hypothetical protein Hte_002889 [Hypoxylon texense]
MPSGRLARSIDLAILINLKRSVQINRRYELNRPIPTSFQQEVKLDSNAEEALRVRRRKVLPMVFQKRWNGIQYLSVPRHQFLEKTATLTKHRNRLVDEASLARGLRVFSTGKHMRSLACRLDEHIGLANVDTGSDLNFVSESFARARGFDPDEEYHEVGFADGTIRVNFAIGTIHNSIGFIPSSQTTEVEFHILPDLSSDILIGYDTIEELNIFTEHRKSFVTRTRRTGKSEVCIIRFIG